MSEQEEVWLSEYLQCWNATEAARRAGYKWPNKVGPDKKLKFADEIRQRIDEKAMSADEVLIRMGEHARGDMGEFVSFKDGVSLPFLDLKAANEKGLLRLVKKFKYNAQGFPEIELYDAQSALRDIGKHHGLWDNDAGSSEDKPLIVKVIKGIDLSKVLDANSDS